jgi:hypothetical protein
LLSGAVFSAISAFFFAVSTVKIFKHPLPHSTGEIRLPKLLTAEYAEVFAEITEKN